MKEIIVTIGVLDVHRAKFQLIKEDDFKTTSGIMSNSDIFSLKVDIFNIMKHQTNNLNLLNQDISIEDITILDIVEISRNLFKEKIVITI